MSLAEGRFGLGGKYGLAGSYGLAALRGLFLASSFLAVPFLGGCGDSGFHPLYGSALINGDAVNERLAAVDVAPIPGRVGQRIRNELIFQTTGGGSPKPPQYRLDIAIRESVTSMLVAVDGNAGNQIYGLDATYSLVRLSDKKVVAHGSSYGRASFDRVSSIFANVEARQDAENRAAETVGEELRTRLLAVLASKNA
jgi:LPS-assembly lipoprotein